VLVSIGVSVAWVLLSRRLVGRFGPSAGTGWILLAGTAGLIPAVLVLEGPPPLLLPPVVWGALAALAVGSTAGAFVLWNLGLSRMESGRAAVYLNLEPVVGAGLGVAWFGDVLGLPLAVGGALVLAGAVVASGRRDSLVGSEDPAVPGPPPSLEVRVLPGVDPSRHGRAAADEAIVRSWARRLEPDSRPSTSASPPGTEPSTFFDRLA
jgi:hypothetical protein